MAKNQEQQRIGDTAKENISRQQETKIPEQRTGSGETSTPRAAGKSASPDGTRVEGTADIETEKTSERDAGAPAGDNRDSRNH